MMINKDLLLVLITKDLVFIPRTNVSEIKTGRFGDEMSPLSNLNQFSLASERLFLLMILF